MVFILDCKSVKNELNIDWKEVCILRKDLIEKYEM